MLNGLVKLCKYPKEDASSVWDPKKVQNRD